MKKTFKRLIIFTVLIIIGVYIINSETDFFRTFDEKYPEVSENHPEISDFFGMIGDIPTISQIAAHITNEEMPLSPEDFAENAYIHNSPLLTFYEKESIGVNVNSNSVTVFGILQRLNKSYVAVRFVADTDKIIYENIFPTDTEYKFSKTMEIPNTDAERLSIEIYTGAQRYGNYDGIVHSYIYIVKTENGWKREDSPVLENNRLLYEEKRPVSKALKATEFIESDSAGVKSVAEQLTQNCTTDYEKLLNLHDWLCKYLHYDNDSLAHSKIADYKSTDVLKSRKAVCLGFANLYAALCRSINIPCYVVTGYALGISSGEPVWTDKIIKSHEENHAWNEAYADGRWIIIDTTWDTFNNYENGQMEKGTEISHLYFDSNIDFFSTNHKIMNYDNY